MPKDYPGAKEKPAGLLAIDKGIGRILKALVINDVKIFFQARKIRLPGLGVTDPYGQG